MQPDSPSLFSAWPDSLSLSGSRFKGLLFLLLLAHLFLGTAQIALMPPFEGVDETAHYSRLKSQAFNPEEQNLPRAQQRKPVGQITAEIYDYYRNGPMPYQWITNPTLHQFDTDKTFNTYHHFFQQPEKIDRYLQLYREKPSPGVYNPGPETNWQYQHPALYYILFAPVMQITALMQLNLVDEILILRWLSFCLAFLGFAVGLAATKHYLTALGHEQPARFLTLCGAFYPFLTPVYSFEFARVGNDGMCLFWAGVAWTLLLKHLRDYNVLTLAMLGLALGLGCATKAIMAPLCLGFIGFLAHFHWRQDRQNKKTFWLPPLIAGSVALIIAAPAYMNQSHSAAVASQVPGSLEFSALFLRGHELFSTFFAHFSPGLFAQSLSLIMLTSVWSFATWSHPLSNDSGIAVILATVCLGLLYNAWRAARHSKNPEFFYLAFWLIIPVFAGLIAHALLSIALYHGQLSTPGRYIHIAAPALSLGLATGMIFLIRKNWAPFLWLGMCGAGLAAFAVIWPQMTLFGGCSIIHDEGNNISLWLYPNMLMCFDQIGIIFHNLAILAHPYLALACFIFGVSSLGCALYGLRPCFTRPQHPVQKTSA